MRPVGVVIALALGCGRFFNGGAGTGDATTPDVKRVHVTAPGSSQNTMTMSFAVDPAPGSLVLVIDYSLNCSLPSMITDTQSSTWGQLPAERTSCMNDDRMRMWYATVAGGPDTITLYCASSTGVLGGIAVEYTGVDPTIPIDSQTAQAGVTTDTTNAITGALVVTRPTTVVASFADNYITGTIAPGPNFSTVAVDDTIPIMVEDVMVGPGSYMPSAVLPKADHCWFGAAAVLRPQ
jgi:hypothetical protein